MELACPKCGHDVDHSVPCPKGCPLCDYEHIRREWYALRRDEPSNPRASELEARLRGYR